MGFQDLESRYGNAADGASLFVAKRAREDAKGLVVNPDYKVVKINSFDEAAEYSGWT